MVKASRSSVFYLLCALLLFHVSTNVLQPKITVANVYE